MTEDRSFTLTHGTTVYASTDIEAVTFNDLNELCEVFRDTVTDCDIQVKTELPYFTAGLFDIKRRKKINLRGAEVIILDFDGVWTIKEGLEWLTKRGWAYFLYASWSHQPDIDERFRVVLPLRESVTPEQASMVARALVADGAQGVDPSKYGAESAMYLTAKHRHIETHVNNDGEYLDGLSLITKHDIKPEVKKLRKRDPKLIALADKLTAQRGEPDYFAPKWDQAIVSWWYDQPVWHTSMPALASKIRVYTACNNRIALSPPELETALGDFIRANAPASVIARDVTPDQLSDAVDKALGLK